MSRGTRPCVGEVLPFTRFETRARRVAFNHRTGGYLKTRVRIGFDNGDSHELRLDLAEHQDQGFQHHVEQGLAWAETKAGQDRIAGWHEEMHIQHAELRAFWASIDFTPVYAEELTPIGPQLVIPGCEKVAPDKPDKPVQLGLFN